MQLVRVLVVSSNPLARAGMAGLLEGANGVELAGSVAPRQALEFLETIPTDVVLADVGDRGVDDDDAIDALMGRGERVVALTGAPIDVQRALARGLAGALPGNIDQETLVAALTAAACGLAVFEPADVRSSVRIEQDAHSPARAIYEPLTSREHEVLRLIAAGLTNRQIARRLSLSEHTVKFHATSVLGKLQSHSRAEAVVRAIGLGWLPI